VRSTASRDAVVAGSRPRSWTPLSGQIHDRDVGHDGPSLGVGDFANMRSSFQEHGGHGPASPAGLDRRRSSGILNSRSSDAGTRMDPSSQLVLDHPAPDRAGLPGVVVGVTAFGPRARVEGTRLDVWFLLDALVEMGSPDAVAEHFQVPVGVAWAAVAYAREFPSRLEAERTAARDAESEAERRYAPAR
jgi:uncharacterized protein (DUF433 family)